ncbi:MAG: PQQ-dependent sugar dehydrogenase [Anaerolineales bacterium]|nr:PQQ-dependent sugar dehydrogenase [Anaerolineales bacterium]
MCFERLQRFIFTFTLVMGVFLLILAVVPGDVSPLGVLQSLANAFANDGSFGGLDLALYRKIQWAMLGAGLALLALSGAIALARRRARPLWARNLTFALGAGYLLAILLMAELGLGRSQSLVYRQVFGPVTPAPTATALVYPTAVPPPQVYGTGQWQKIAEGIVLPTAIVNPGDGSGRLFILEEEGVIRVMQNETLLAEPFFDLRDRVIQETENYEQGLLGLAFHPNFAENGYFYVFYVDYQENSVISRFQTLPGGQAGDPNSEFRLLGILKPGPRHYGGSLGFGPDGYLYVSIGDGDLRQKTLGHAQSLDELFGKILRLDVDHGNPYAIPADNPFVEAYGRDEIYLYGLRNPWKFSFDPATGDLYIGDVGQNDWEEINFLAAGDPAGVNYGWDVREGPEDFSGYRGAPVLDPNFVEPIFYYHHKPLSCSVTGGAVYHGENFPEMQGKYILGDFCSGYIWSLERQADGTWDETLLFDTNFQIAAFGTGADGELYLADYLGGIYKWMP